MIRVRGRRINIMPELIINERDVNGVRVLQLEGKVTIGEGAVSLRSTIRRLLAEGVKKIVLDLGNMSYLDSSGSGEITSAWTSCYKEECILVFASPQQKLMDAWTITKLNTVYVIFPTFNEAVEAIKDLSFSDFISKYLKHSSN